MSQKTARATPVEPWLASAFVTIAGDVPLSLIPTWISGLVVKVAHGTGPPEQPIPSEWLEQARRSFDVYAWAWCDGINVEEEAEWHASLAAGYAGFCANMEEPYDAHGDASSPKYTLPARYLEVLRREWNGPLAVTTTWSHGSDMTAWVQAGALTMPQAFSKEIPSATLFNAVNHAKSWGWPAQQIRPLLQCYPTNGHRPDPVALNKEAETLGVGGVPYHVGAAMDEAGQQWLSTARPTIERAQANGGTVPEPEPPPPAVLIGSQHGITAMCNNWRTLWPQWTNPGRDPNNLSTWKAIDKLERTLLMLAADHDARQSL